MQCLDQKNLSNSQGFLAALSTTCLTTNITPPSKQYTQLGGDKPYMTPDEQGIDIRLLP